MSVKLPPKKDVVAFAEITLSLGVPIGQIPLEDALVKARALKVTDVVDLKGADHNDSTIRITGVYEE